MGLIVDQQLKSNDCGISAVKTVFNILRKEVDRGYIQEHIFLDQSGSSLGDIKKFFDSHGCKSALKFLDVSLSNDDLSSLRKLFPFIIPVKRGNELHYIVVNGIKGKKLKIYDPSGSKPYYISFSALRAIAHYTRSNWKMVDFKDRIEALCTPELARYGIPLGDLSAHQDVTHLFNKLVYFSYVRDNFGFKDEKSEKSFLEDLLYNQDVETLPEQFKQLKGDNERVKLSAPLVLSVKELPAEEIKYDLATVEPNIYSKLFTQLGSNRKLWYIYLATVLFAASITQFTVFVNQILIDHVLPSFQLNILTLFAVGFALFRIFNLLISQYKHFVSIHVGNILDKYFLNTFNEKLNVFSLRYAQTFKRGDLTERLSDTMRLKSFFLRIFSSMLVDIFVSLSSLAVLFYINWSLTLMICGVVLIYFLWFRIITPYLQFNERKRFVIKADFISRMIERIEGNQVIKCFGLNPIFTNRIHRNITDLIDIQTKTKYIDLLNSAFTSVISTVAYTLIVVFLARNSIFAQTPLSFGQLITFIMLSERVFSAWSGILGENLTLQENEIILRRYFDFNEPARNTQREGIREFTIDSLTLSKISFGYNPSIPVLKNVDFQINKGDKVKIEGGNGSGKSSLGKILSFLYDPDQGDIIINGTKCNFFNREALKGKILLVTNEDILFNGTILFNVTFDSDVPHADIIELAKEIGLYEFIASHEEGLNFTINENGKNLSTGQRKKVLIMRALLSNAEIVILDEVLSGIDQASREKIENLIEATTSKTFVLISHEPVKNVKFDWSFTLTNGELAYAEY